ncbi:MAG: leucine-rich repeat protein [Mogibacterium sp.]|nr:leucine-rich repeat protein [Mogibacterium sp.]
MNRNHIRSIRVFFFALIILVSGCLNTSSTFVFADTETTTDYRYPDKYAESYSHFKSLKTLTSEGTFPVPGLEVTVGLHKDDNGDLANFYSSNSGMVPQGITIANGYRVISAYDASEEGPSVLYVSPLGSTKWTTISLFEMDKGVFFKSSTGEYPGNKESINHVGGLASDDEGNLYIAKSGKRAVARISYDRLVEAASYVGKSVAMSYDAELSVSTTASFLTWYRNMLWVGVCTSGKGILTGYSIGSTDDGVLSIEEKMNCTISGKANGAAFCEVNGHECLALNVSSGRNSSKSGYISEMWLYEAGFSDTSISLNRRSKLTLPPMAEEIDVYNGTMYTIFESGATKYAELHPDDVCDYVVDRVCMTTPEKVFLWTDPKYNETEMSGTLSGKGAQFDSSIVYSGTATEASAVKEISVTYNNDLQSGGSVTTGFIYSDEMLLKSALQSNGKPDTDVAKVAVGLASAAYKKSNIQSALTALECGSMTFYNYGRKATFTDNDFTGFSIGRKRVYDESDVYTIYFVTVRGTPASAEWFSDFNLGTSGKHTGFHRAEDEIYDVLEKDFFASDGSDASHRKFLVTGHSRGAAVANILAAALSNSGYANASNVFGYTYACPAVSKTANASMNNIYNFNYAGDLVPAVPPEKWGYGRNGHTYDLVMDSNALTQFKRVFGKDFAASTDTNNAVKTLTDLLQGESNYTLALPGLQLAACMLGNQDITSIKAVITGAPIKFSAMLGNQIAEGLGNKELTVVEEEYKGECQELLEQVKAGIKDIDKKLENADDEDERARIWSNWCTDNRAMLSDIVDLTAISVSKRSDLDAAKEYLEDEAVIEHSTALNLWQNLVSTFVASRYNPQAALTHGHMPGTYVIGINSMFFGYEGWYGNSTHAADPAASTAGNINSIGPRCFYGCTSLKALTVPDGGLDYVGSSAFSGASALSIIYGDLQLNKYVGNYAFSGCSGLTSLKITGTIKTLGYSAFRECSGLKKVEIPVTAKYKAAFSGSNGDPTFYSCGNVEEIVYTAGSGEVNEYFNYEYSLPYYAKNKLAKVTLENGITEIPASLLRGCSNVTYLSIPDSVTKIGSYAFSGCSSWKPGDVTLSDNLTSIGTAAFNGVGVSRVLIPATVIEVGSSAFAKSSSLKIYGERDSVAEKYASANSNTFIAINEIFISGAPEEADPGSKHQLTAKMVTGIDKSAENFDWSVSGNTSEKTVISEAGLLTAGEDEDAMRIKVKAEHGKYDSEVVIAIAGGTVSTDLADATVSDVPDTEYTGEAIEPEVTLAFGETELVKDEDYTVEYSNNVDAGEATIICKAAGKLTGTVEIHFNILKAQNEWTEELTCSDTTTDFTPEPKAVAKFGDVSYVFSNAEDGEYTDTVPEAAGEYYVKAVVADTDNYSGLESAAVKFSITVDLCKDGHDIEKVEAAEPTCAAEGNEEYYRCKRCGKPFADENGEVELEAAPVIAKTAHVFDEGAVTTEPTCTEPGEKTYTCTVCGGTETEAIPANGHTEETVSAVEPKCTEEGLTEGVKCSVCGEILEAQQIIEPLGHDWGAWETVSAPNCADKGSQMHICGRCGEKEFKDVDPNGHTWTEEYVIDTYPTCASEGSESWHCSECGVSDPDHTRTISKLSHDFGQWTTTRKATCEVTGISQRSCNACSYLETKETPATGHTDEVIPAAAATCTDDGLTAGKKCAVCGKILKAQEKIPALGHTWGAWKTVNEPTVNTEGSKERVCSVCGKKETASIEKLPPEETKNEEQKPAEPAGPTEEEKAAAAAKAAEEKAAAEKAATEKAVATAKETVNKTVADAKSIEQGIYSDESYKALQNAVAEAEALAGKPNATAEQLKAAADKVEAAKEALTISEEEPAKPSVKTGDVKKYKKNTYKVLSVKSKKVAFTKAKNARSVVVPASIKIDGQTYKVTQINANAFKSSKIKTITIGKNVKVIKKNALKGSRATKLILRTKLLKKTKIKGSMKGSKIRTVQVKVGSRSANKKFVKSYKRIFTKKNAGKKVTVK